MRSKSIFPWWLWIAVGFALDLIFYVSLDELLISLRIRDATIASWLMAMILVTVPWVIHVIALPLIFRLSRPPILGLLLNSGVFLIAAGSAIPIVGAFLFVSFGYPLSMVIESLFRPDRVPFWIERFVGPGPVILPAVGVGAVIGVAMHVFRDANVYIGTRETAQTRSDYLVPSMRSDALGGAAAACVIFTAFCLGSVMDGDAQPGETFDDPIRPPVRIFIIAAFAILPHFVMTRPALRARSRRDA